MVIFHSYVSLPEGKSTAGFLRFLVMKQPFFPAQNLHLVRDLPASLVWLPEGINHLSHWHIIYKVYIYIYLNDIPAISHDTPILPAFRFFKSHLVPLAVEPSISSFHRHQNPVTTSPYVTGDPPVAQRTTKREAHCFMMFLKVGFKTYG